MNISLTAQMEQQIQEKIDFKRFHSPVDVVQEALRVLNEQDRLQEKKETLQKEIQIGLESGEAKPLNMEEVITNAQNRFDKRNETKAS